MRYLAIAFLLLSSLVVRSEEIPGLSAFAEQYWSAIRAQDFQKIFALYEAKVFSDLSPAEAEFMKEYWMKSYSEKAKQQGDSYQITMKALPGDAAPFPEWRWAAQPQYQIDIQTFRNVPGGREGLTGVADMVVRKEGRFFIVRPVPPKELLQKQMQKRNG